MEKLEELKKYLKSFSGPQFKEVVMTHASVSEMSSMFPEQECVDLELTKEFLLKLKAFEDVKRIQLVPTPVYVAKKGTEEPAVNYRGETHHVSIQSIAYNDDVKFAEDMYIYSIRLGQQVFDNEEINEATKKVGEWILPTRYDDTFTPIKEIRVSYYGDTMENNGIACPKNKKKEILEQVSKFLDGELESNVPFDRQVIIRCSPESVIKG